jgi:hypothetical protein
MRRSVISRDASMWAATLTLVIGGAEFAQPSLLGSTSLPLCGLQTRNENGTLETLIEPEFLVTVGQLPQLPFHIGG